MPFIHVEMLEGRTLDQKRKLVENVTKVVCEALDVSPEVVYVFIREMKKEDYGPQGKLAIDR